MCVYMYIYIFTLGLVINHGEFQAWAKNMLTRSRYLIQNTICIHPIMWAIQCHKPTIWDDLLSGIPDFFLCPWQGNV